MTLTSVLLIVLKTALGLAHFLSHLPVQPHGHARVGGDAGQDEVFALVHG